MSLETATYLSDLNVANPPGGDPVSQADDHLRLIKAVLKSTFPNINAAVTATPKQLNSDVVPVGTIMFWYSTVASIPAGWGYCNGSTYAKLDGSGNITSPDLRDKWLVSTGTTYTQGLTDAAPTHSHADTAAFTGTPFSIVQSNLPNVNFPVTDPGHTHQSPFYQTGVSNSPSTFTGAGAGYGGSYTSIGYAAVTVNSGGSGVAITPAGSVAITPHADVGVPPYYSLPAMIKL